MTDDTINAFVVAIQQKDNESAKKLLLEHPSLAEATTAQGISLLLLCAYYGNMELAKIIATQKSKIQIFEACAIGDVPTVKQMLKENPALIHQPASDGFFLLGFACFFGHLELVKFLTNQGADVSQAAQNDFKVAPIHSAVAKGSYEITEYLLAHGAAVNVPQTKGVTALHSAAHLGRLDLVRLLVENGGNVLAKMEDGKTVLEMATEKEFDAVADYLRQNGAN